MAKKLPKIEVDDDLCEMINWAVRYAIGRRTYAVSDTCRFVTKNIDKLNDHTLWCIVEDVNRAQHDKFYKEPLGDPVMDAPEWLKLRDMCKEKLKERNSRYYEPDWGDLPMLEWER